MRYALGLEYDGAAFFGWQRQHDTATVQRSVEDAVTHVADHPVTVICAGRTDTGVHARGQVVHFDSGATRSERQWLLGINSNLPAAVRVIWVRAVDDSFHARFSAYSRTYQYTILNRWVRPAINHSSLGWCRYPLDAVSMNEASQVLLGEHDFSAFRSAGCSANHAVRQVSAMAVTRQDEYIMIEITANAFLYHMVRNIVGSLVAVGRGEETGQWFADVLQSGDRRLAGITAEPQGLCFIRVRYDSSYDLPGYSKPFPEAFKQS